MDEEQLRLLFEQLQKALEEEAEQKRVLGKASKEVKDDLDRLRKSLRDSGTDIKSLSKSVAAAQEAEKKREAEAKKYIEGVKSGSAVFGKSVMGMVGAAGAGETSFAMLSGTVKGLSSAIGNLVGGIPVIGKFLEGTAKASADAAAFVLGRLDEVAKAYTELGKVGGITSTGIDGLRKQFDQVGLVALPDFVDAIKNNSVAMRAFGPTVAQGGEMVSKSFGLLTRRGGEYIDRLSAMGYSIQDVAKITVEYGANQVLMGNRRIKTEKDLAKASFDYMKEIDELARATGQSKEAILDEQKKNRLDVAFNEYINDLMKTDPKAAERLNKYVSSLGGVAAEAARAMAIGAPTTERARKATVLYGDAISQNMELVKQGLDPEKARQRTFEAGIENMEQMSNVIQANVLDPLGGPEGIRQLQEYRAQQNAGALSTEEAAKETKKLSEQTPDLTKKFIDAQLQIANLARETQKLGFEFINNATPAVKGFTKALTDGIVAIRKGLGIQETTSAAGSPVKSNLGPAAKRLARKRAETAPGEQPTAETPGAPADGKKAGRPISTSGLRLKSPEAMSGGESDSRLIELAYEIQNALGGDLTYFSAFNDSYERRGNSKHPQGLALDFTIKNPKYSAGTASLVRDIMSRAGLKGKVKDEYIDSSASKTGGHIHVELDALAKGGITNGPSVAGEDGPEAVVPLPDGKSIPVELRNLRINGLGMDGSYMMGSLSTDTKLTDMIMQRLGLTDFESRRQINLSGIGMNYNIGGTELGSKMGGGVMQNDIADQVAKLVDKGQPLQEALKSTVEQLTQALTEFTSKARDSGQLESMVSQLVELQRSQNYTSEKILQVSQN